MNDMGKNITQPCGTWSTWYRQVCRRMWSAWVGQRGRLCTAANRLPSQVIECSAGDAPALIQLTNMQFCCRRCGTAGRHTAPPTPHSPPAWSRLLAKANPEEPQRSAGDSWAEEGLVPLVDCMKAENNSCALCEKRLPDCIHWSLSQRTGNALLCSASYWCPTFSAVLACYLLHGEQELSSCCAPILWYRLK